MSETKILSLSEIKSKSENIQQSGKTVVLCYGHFNVIHPGHIRFLEFAKSQGDELIVAIRPELNHKENSFFPQLDRAKGVANLSMVDSVYPLQESISQFIETLRPNLYVKGREFERIKAEISDEIAATENSGGKILFSSGDLTYSDLSFSNGQTKKEIFGRRAEFIATCNKLDISFRKICSTLDTFKDLRVLVVGDTIVDQFVSCDTMGVSSEAPVLAIRELGSEQFLGGAGIVAKHMRALSAQTSFISVVGKDLPGDYARKNLEDFGVESHLFTEEDRPTTFKIRYMVENQKLLRVSRLKQHQLHEETEKKVIEKLYEIIPHVNAVVISDFVYGVITPKIIETIQDVARKNNVKIFGDLQCSSQVGDVSKFKGFELLTPTEKEARIALHDHTSGLEQIATDLKKKTESRNLAITLGNRGVLVHRDDQIKGPRSEYFPALVKNPIDVAGAGDSFLAGSTLALCSDLDSYEAVALGSILAAISVGRVGNLPISVDEVSSAIDRLSSNSIPEYSL